MINWSPMIFSDECWIRLRTPLSFSSTSPIWSNSSAHNWKPPQRCSVCVSTNFSSWSRLNSMNNISKFYFENWWLNSLSRIIHRIRPPRCFDLSAMITTVFYSVSERTNSSFWFILFLGNWLQETDYQMIEEQLQPNSASGSGALEHDETFLYRRETSSTAFNIINYLFRSSSTADSNASNAYYSRPAELNIPGPLPLGVAVIDASILLYGTMFIRVPNKHRLNMLQHFIDTVKQTKGARQEAVQVNIFTAVLTALKILAETKQSSAIDDENVKKCASTLVMQTLSHQNPILRCAAGEALGRLTQVVGDGRFVADIAQICFDRLKEFRDISPRTGYSLALGCLHRYVGGMSTGQYLNLSVSILLALAQDQSASIVQVWALHALALIADCGGQMFRSYVEPSLALILHLLLSVSPSQTDVFQCCGRLLGALITTVGPELQSNTNYISILRSSCLTSSSLLQMHIEPIIQAEAIQALQQLHLFAPRHVNLSALVPELIKALKSRDLSLRRACVSCLRQLSQREAKEVSDHARSFMKEKAQDLSIGLAEFRSLEG